MILSKWLNLDSAIENEIAFEEADQARIRLDYSEVFILSA